MFAWLSAMLPATPSALKDGFLPLTLMTTSSVPVGTWPWLQFVVVFQSLSVVPLNVFVTAAAGAAVSAKERAASANSERVMGECPPRRGPVRPLPSGGCALVGRPGWPGGRAARVGPPPRRPRA